MQPAENTRPRSSIGEQLSEAYRLFQELQAHDALAIVKDVKHLEPRNVYVLAFEKQLEQFIQLSESRTLTEDQRVDIMDSIPGIIDRAIEGAAVEQLSAERNQRALQESKDEKAAALEWLKDQYFQHAHEYVQKGQYDHALAEIRRVYIIDPGNTTAQEFERRIEHLTRVRTEPPSPAPAPTLRLVTKESLRVEELIAPEIPEEPAPAPAPPQPVPVPVKTGEFSSPAVLPVEKPKARAAAPPVRKRMRPAAVVLVLLAVIAVGAAGYFLWTQRQTQKRADMRRGAVIATPQAETFVGPSTTVDERVFVISNGSTSETPTPTVEEETPAKKERAAPPKASRTTRKETASRSALNAVKAKESTESAPKISPPIAEQKPNPVQKPAQPPASSPQVTEEAPPSTTVVEKSAEIIRLEPIQVGETSGIEELEGQAVVQVQIDAAGKPIGTRVLSSSNPVITQPIVKALMKSKYSPAQMSSGPVTSWMTIPFKFKKR